MENNMRLDAAQDYLKLEGIICDLSFWFLYKDNVYEWSRKNGWGTILCYHPLIIRKIRTA